MDEPLVVNDPASGCNEWEPEELLSNDNTEFSTRVDLFCQRLEGIISNDDEDIGKVEYLKACRALQIQPNIVYLDSIIRSHVDLQYFGVSGPGLIAIGTSISSNKYICHLDLSRNNIGDYSVACFFEQLMKGGGNDTLTTLILKGELLHKEEF